MVKESILVLVVLCEELAETKLGFVESYSHLINKDCLHTLEDLGGQLLGVQLHTDSPVFSLGNLLKKTGDLKVIEVEVRSFALLHASLELLNGHGCDIVRVNQKQELSFIKVSLFGNLGQLDDCFVHEVKLGNSLKLSDKTSVLEETNVPLKNILQESKLAGSDFDTKSVQSTLKLLRSDFSAACDV
jgi:hypothetical protein